MAAVLAGASYSRGGFSTCLTSSAMRVMVPGGSTSTCILEQYTIYGTLLVPDVFDAVWISRKLHSFQFVIEGGGDVK